MRSVLSGNLEVIFMYPTQKSSDSSGRNKQNEKKKPAEQNKDDFRKLLTLEIGSLA